MKLSNVIADNMIRLIHTIPWSMNRKRLSRAAIFLIVISCTSGSLYAGSQKNSTSTSWEQDLPGFNATLNPVTTHELTPSFSSVDNADSQTNSDEEYHTFGPGEQPPITEWTQFPGPKSNVGKPTVFASTANYSFNFAASSSETLYIFH